MKTFENLKKIISIGRKSNDEIMGMMDVFLMNDRITYEQYNDLATLLPQAELDIEPQGSF